MAVGRITGVTVLTGYFYKEMYWRFAWTKKNGRNNEVAVLTRWLLTLGFYNVSVVPITGVTVLTGYFYKEMYWRFAWTKKNGRNNEVAVLTKWP